MAETPNLKFYNTLTRSKDAFAPADATNVRMYVCGPTVYDYAHIGNARPAIVFDVLFRLLRHTYGADHVTYVRNITDVDDKINARALRDFPDLPLNEAIRKVTDKTETQYKSDVAALGCLKPTYQPRATENIVEMIAIVQSLLDKGHAYVAQGTDGREALFDVRSMNSYGQLSKRNLGDQQAGARIAVESHKRNPEDFVLWKESAPNEPGWSASFNISDENMEALRANQNQITIFGRPGWHIECSAMSKRYLGETFDIHGGGLDLIFPHHENEIAQSRCAFGTDVMAKVWMHNGFLQVEGRKMSKSEGNFVTIHELLETEKFGGRKWPGEVLRLAMLMTHYREPIDFSVKRLEEAEIISFAYRDYILRYGPDESKVIPEVIQALRDDLNTPLAIQEIQRSSASQESIAATLYFLGLENKERAKQGEKIRQEHRAELRTDIEAAIRDVELKALGVPLLELEKKITMRLSFIAAKNWPEADRIRDDLAAKGIQLKDGKDPATGERITTWEVKR